MKLRSPKGKSLDKPVTLKWSSRDADGDKRFSTLQYAADGKHYVTIAAALKKRKFKVDPATFPAATRLASASSSPTASSPGSTSPSRSQVAAKAPTDLDRNAGSTAPRSAEGQSVQLVASVTDDQDARLYDDVVWSSDAQGELGKGGSLATVLQPGTHVITATVTNSLGKSASTKRDRDRRGERSDGQRSADSVSPPPAPTSRSRRRTWRRSRPACPCSRGRRSRRCPSRAWR